MSDISFSVTESPVSFTIDESALTFVLTDPSISFEQPTDSISFNITEETLVFSYGVGSSFVSNTVFNVPQEDEVLYASKVDFVGDTLIYRADAEPGSASSSPVWRIRRMTIAVDGDVTQEWADGDNTFTKVWDDRLSLTYL